MALYKILQGRLHHRGERYIPGDIAPLTQAVVAVYGVDRLEYVCEEPASKTEPQPAREREEAARNAELAHLPAAQKLNRQQRRAAKKK